MRGALKGLRVLDLSRLLPGPFASLVLADLGADVDKVEELGGDYLRHMPPMTPGGDSAMFNALNRGKRSIALDLKKPAATQVLLDLLPKYDVLLEQFRPGVLDRLGLSHATLRAKNPRLVVCALTGYGQTGPLSKRAGHDLNYLARAGVLGQQGPAAAPPQLPGFQLADVGGALWSVIGILAAIAERDRTGEGAVVDVSMAESSMPFAVAGFGALFAGLTLARGDEPLTGGLAGYGTYATKDGKFVALGALEPKFLMAFFEGVGEPFESTALVPGPHQVALRDRLATIFRQRTRDEWAAFGKEKDCCLEPVLAPEELEKDPHLADRGAFFTIESTGAGGPSGTAPGGPLRQLKTPIVEKGGLYSAPPRLGEHTDAILREAGLGDAEISRMKAEGAARS